MLEQSLVIFAKALGPEHPTFAYPHANLGLVLEKLGRYEEARTMHERALAILEKALGPEHPNVAFPLTYLGYALIHLGDLDAARRHLERALAIREKALDSTHSAIAETLLGLGKLAMAKGQPDAAVLVLERALPLDNPTFQADVEMTLAEAHWTLGKDRPRARELAEKARVLYQSMGNQPELTRVSRWLAEHPLLPAPQ